MISFLQHLYSRIYIGFQIRHYKANNKLLWVMSILSLIVLSKIIYWSFVIRSFLGCLPPKLTGNGDIFVSLTSFPARIGIVWLTIDSIMRQKLRPANITLYLSKEEFPQKRDLLPKRLRKYENLGLRIVFVDNNLKPHKKYFYSFQDNHGKCIVTVDDDLLYDDDLLLKLWDIHSAHPGCICANKGRKISLSKDGFNSYNNWDEIIDMGDFVGSDLLACGYGGVLYPPDFYLKFRDRICDAQAIEETSLCADDLWLKAQELRADVKVCVRSYYPHPVSLPSSSKSALSTTNRDMIKNGNDNQWILLDNKYNLRELILRNDQENIIS